MRRSNRARLAAVGLAALRTLAILRCTPTAFDASVHSLGQYRLCLRRLSDACVAEDGGCRSVAASTGTVSLGEDDDGGFFWSRTDLAPIRGRRAGDRFVVATTEKGVTTLCGCAADVTETIRGELATERLPAADCEGDQDGGCGDEAATSEFFDGGLPDPTWLDGEAQGGSATGLYGSFRATVTDDARASASSAGRSCPCLPCRVVFEARGTQ